jgi:hypothetical protein
LYHRASWLKRRHVIHAMNKLLASSHIRLLSAYNQVMVSPRSSYGQLRSVGYHLWLYPKLPLLPLVTFTVAGSLYDRGNPWQEYLSLRECVYRQILFLNFWTSEGKKASECISLQCSQIFERELIFATFPNFARSFWYEQHIDKHSWNDTDRENRNTRRNPRPSVTLSITHLTWIGLWSNPGFRGERPAINRLSHGRTISRWKVTWIIVKRLARTAQ